jgi:hypothetical protein
VPRFSTAHRPRLVLGLVAVLALLPACSKDKSSSATKATTTTLPPTYPLTGLPPGGDPASLTRGAVAVKIDNVAAARPQSGVGEADVVYEELAEGGLTRFVVVFQSTDAAEVGPVRSARPSDAEIVLPLNGVLVCSGGAPGVLDYVRGAGVNLVEIESVSGASTRRSDRSAPHNLYTSTADLYGGVAASLPAPPKLSDFLQPGQPFAAAGAVPAAGLDFAAGPSVDAAYEWDPATATWKRSTGGRPHLVEGGSQLAPTNVILQFTPSSEFEADSKVSVAQATGFGEAWILTSGMLVKGTWEKFSPTAVTVFKDAAGAPVRLPPGRTFVQLIAPGSAATPR